jgi:hypothetical protein
MKILFRILCTAAAFSFFSCGSGVDEQAVKKRGDSIASAEESERVKRIQEDSASRAEEEKKNYKGEKVESFRLVCSDNCNDGHMPKESEVEKNGRQVPFQLKKSVDKDSLSLSFRYIDHCCLKFAGALFQKNDTLSIQLSSTSKPCDCYCDYALKIKVKGNLDTWKGILIGKKLVR